MRCSSFITGISTPPVTWNIKVKEQIIKWQSDEVFHRHSLEWDNAAGQRKPINLFLSRRLLQRLLRSQISRSASSSAIKNDVVCTITCPSRSLRFPQPMFAFLSERARSHIVRPVGRPCWKLPVAA
jgi:hypothetical protein